MKKETYCLVCRDYTKNNNPKIVTNRQNGLVIKIITCVCKILLMIKIITLTL